MPTNSIVRRGAVVEAVKQAMADLRSNGLSVIVSGNELYAVETRDVELGLLENGFVHMPDQFLSDKIGNVYHTYIAEVR